MPASWEITPKVLVCTLHTEMVPIAWALGLRNLIIPGNLPPLPVSGMPYDHARNFCCQAAIQKEADYIFFLDSDVVTPRDAIPRLMAHGQPFVSGMYCRRMPPWSVPVARKNGNWFVDDELVKAGKVVEVDLVGAGCLLLSRDFLIDMASRFPLAPQLGKLWFHWRSDIPNLPAGYNTSEDFSTCLAARQNGYKVFLDTSIVCRHIGLADSTYREFKPSEVRPET